MGSWSKIATAVDGRTDNQCWRRWSELHAEERLSYTRAQRKRRDVLPAALPRSKRARRTEEVRATQLGPGDFVLGVRPELA